MTELVLGLRFTFGDADARDGEFRGAVVLGRGKCLVWIQILPAAVQQFQCTPRPDYRRIQKQEPRWLIFGLT